jgi:hypothetical protein
MGAFDWSHTTQLETSCLEGSWEVLVNPRPPSTHLTSEDGMPYNFEQDCLGCEAKILDGGSRLCACIILSIRVC